LLPVTTAPPTIRSASIAAGAFWEMIIVLTSKNPVTACIEDVSGSSTYEDQAIEWLAARAIINAAGKYWIGCLTTYH